MATRTVRLHTIIETLAIILLVMVGIMEQLIINTSLVLPTIMSELLMVNRNLLVID